MREIRGFLITHILQLPLLLFLCCALTPAASQDSLTPPPFTPDQCPDLSTAQNAMKITETNCYYYVDYVMDNAMCCPQYRTTWKILLGQNSKSTGLLALNQPQSVNCLPYFDSQLEGRGTNGQLGERCSIHAPDLTQGTCPVLSVNDFESTVDSTSLLGACGHINPANECCTKVCQRAMLAAAAKLSLKGTTARRLGKLKFATRVKDCTNIVLNWLASKLDQSSANGLFRALEICNINRVCPLHLGDVTGVSNACGGSVVNNTSCCSATDSYLFYLQYQSVLTDTQAVNCALTLGLNLQKANVTQNVYKLCNKKLMDFAASVGNSNNCLVPNVPEDGAYDSMYGLHVSCDPTYANVEAPWPSNSSGTVANPCRKIAT